MNPIPSAVREEDELFLGVKIGNDLEVSPREKLKVVPGAAVAQVALTYPDGLVTNDKLGADVNNYLIQSGYLQCDWVSCPGYTLHTGIGDRILITRINFPSTYLLPPKVVVSIAQLDIFAEIKSRLKAYA